jgi:twinkle protein
MTDFSDKKHIKNFACPKCSTSGTGKSAALYVLGDGKEFWNCYDPGCPTKGKPQFDADEISTKVASGIIDAGRGNVSQRNYTTTREEVNTYPIKDLETRGITAETAKHFGIRVSMNSTTGEIDTHYFPYHIKKELAGYKVRRLPKQFMTDIGSTAGVDPFGWNTLKKGAKKLIITEGEYDACIVYQVLSKHFKERDYSSTPQVVSLPNGAKSVKALLKAHEKTLSTYAEIILCFDEDEEGQKAIQDFSVAFDCGDVSVMELPYKDANETFLEEGPQPIISAFWGAKPPKLGGMVPLRECFDMAYEEAEQGLSYPWDIMTAQSGGNKAPEIFILMSGTGAGKTDITTEIVRHLALEHKMEVAFYSLEMSLQKSAKRMVGKQVGRKALSDSTDEQIEEDRARSEGLLDKIKFYDIKQGMLDAKHLIYLMKQQAALEDTKVHVIDNLTQLTSGDKNEKATIDQFIKDLKDLAERYDLRVFLIVHLNRNTGQGIGFEAGAQIGLEHLYGSGGPAKWADTVMALERNQYHSDPEIRNTTLCRWLKDRDSGDSTGKVFALKYDSESGSLTKTKPVDIIESKDEGEF